MPRIEVTLPDRIDAQLENMVEREDTFVSRDEAAEELLEMGLRAYDTEGGSSSDVGLEEDHMRGHEETGLGPGDEPGDGPGGRGPGGGPGSR